MTPSLAVCTCTPETDYPSEMGYPLDIIRVRHEAEYLMKNYGDRGGCCPSRP